MEPTLAERVYIEVFEGKLEDCKEKVDTLLRESTPIQNQREILDISVSDHAILVVYRRK